jgi:hypothetical protein
MAIAGWSFEGSRARLFVLPVVAIAGCATWMMIPVRSDAGSQSAPAPSQVLYAQNISLVDPAAPPEATDSAVAAPVPETTVAEKPAIDGLRISSLSWRRGGLGSQALVTLTLRNSNDYAVRDIEIACAFARRDGSHLTDRRRLLPDAVNGRSRKTYSRMLVGFVNVNADKAKCSPVAASRT